MDFAERHREALLVDERSSSGQWHAPIVVSVQSSIGAHLRPVVLCLPSSEGFTALPRQAGRSKEPTHMAQSVDGHTSFPPQRSLPQAQAYARRNIVSL